jgi:chlorobactene glucosyltransferase
MLLLLSIAWVLVVAGLLTRAITQYRHYQLVLPAGPDAGEPAPMVTVIVPARNEEASIGCCIQALLDQDYPPDRLQLVLVDDHSEDRTAAVAQEVAGDDLRFQLLHAETLPNSWLGKPWACWRGASIAQGEWLCFLDADTIACPPLIRTAVRRTIERKIDLLSLEPDQELVSFWERLLLPDGFFLIAFTHDIRRTNDPAFSDAAVNGQFLLIRRAAYEAVDGHRGVCGAVAEDSALAARMKAAGYRLDVAGTKGLLHTRMYSDVRSLWEGTARQAASLLPGAALPLMALAGLILAWAPLALPAWSVHALASGGGGPTIVALVASLAGSLALFGTHIGAASYFRIPLWYGLLFPVGYTLGAGVMMFAAWQRWHGQTRWKGRVYEAAST